MFSKKFKKVIHWLAVVMLTLPINVLMIVKVEAADPGDVVITEFMSDPALVIDTSGEWLEVQNTTASPITDFSNWKIGSAPIAGSVTIEPGKSAVVCKNGTVSTNGGVKCDFTSAFSLAQSTSTDYQIILKDSDGATINTINYNGSDIISGKSRYTNGTNETINQYGAGDYGTPNSNTIAIGNHSYPTIQTAIDGASANDVINIANGTYNITSVPGITVNKAVTLNGVGSPVITGANKNASTSNGSDVLFNVTVGDVTIQNMTVDLGDSDTDYDVAIFTPNSGSINNLTISNTTLLYAAFGNLNGEQLIHLGGGSGANASNNTFDTASGNSGLYVGDGANSSLIINNNTIASQITSAGGANDTDGGGTFFNQMAPITNSTISGNSFIDTGIAIYLGSGSSDTDTITVSNNTFTSNNGHAAGYGALAITSESDSANTKNITVTGNTFTNSQTQPAVTIFDSINTSVANVIGSTITINGNKFSGNTLGGVSVGSGISGTIDALNNWWGSENGPTHSSNPLGNGDTASNNVSFSPWWTTNIGPSSKAPIVTLTEKDYVTSLLPTFKWVLGGANPDPTITITINGNDTILATKGTTSYVPTTSLPEGNNTWKIKAVNAMGESTSVEDMFFVDTTAPDPKNASITINSGDTVTSSKDLTLTITGVDNLSGVEEMRISQNLVLATSIDQNVDADWTPFATAKQFTLTTDKDGDYAIYMQLKDKAGNVSSIISDTIFYSNSFIGDDVTNPTVDSVNSSNRIIDKINENGLYLEVSEQTVGDANIVIGEYNSLPVDSKPKGISILGKTFEIKTDNSTVFPISLKYYYTSNDLVDAGVLDEAKITGIYYYDLATDTWSLYADTGIVTSNTIISGIEYEGYVWANLDHLTPLTYGADQTAPVKPNNFQVNVISENEVKLSWDRVGDAEKYVIRYKKNISEQNFVYVSIDKNNTSASIINLEGATEYVFEIASVDKVNNYSSFASVTVTTNKSRINELVSNVGLVEVAQAQEEIKAPKITTTTTDINDEGEVKATDDSQKDDEKDESRALITIIILLIALAAGVGGYYGYEYWLLNGQKKTTRKNGKNGKKSGRW